MRNHLLALGLLAGVANAEPVVLEELQLQVEYPVTDMPSGNLSGLALCGETLWAVSDRDDDRLYQLHREDGLLRAEAETFVAPEPPESALPWGLRMRNWAPAWLGVASWISKACHAMPRATATWSAKPAPPCCR